MRHRTPVPFILLVLAVLSCGVFLGWYYLDAYTSCVAKGTGWVLLKDAFDLPTCVHLP